MKAYDQREKVTSFYLKRIFSNFDIPVLEIDKLCLKSGIRTIQGHEGSFDLFLLRSLDDKSKSKLSDSKKT